MDIVLVRRILSCLAVALVASCGGPLPTTREDSPRLFAPYVGQGSGAIVVQEGRAIAFDAGPDSSCALSRVLRDLGIERFDLLVVSHWDLDHVGGLDSLVSQSQVRGILFGAEPVDAWMRMKKDAWCAKIPDGCRLVQENSSQQVLDEERLQILRTNPNAPSENERSMVVRLVGNSGNGLLMAPGDLDTVGEASLLAHHAELDAAALLVGHHGSRGSSSLPFLGAVGASIAIIQAGLRNGYGHPHIEAIERLRAVVPDTRLVGAETTETVTF